MDLARIREKSRLERENGFRQDTVDAATEDTAPGMSRPSAICETEHPCEPVPPAFPYGDAVPAPQETGRNFSVHRDPLEVIMGGREAAGLDRDGAFTTDDSHQERESVSFGKYLCFRVADEVYGINIMDIKEIIRPREVTEVPRAPSFVSGIISLRGVIIPVIDMLDRLGLQQQPLTGRERVIIVRHGDTFSGLVVNEIIQVAGIEDDSIEAAPTVLEGIDRDFVAGIGRTEGRMVIILNLNTITDISLF